MSGWIRVERNLFDSHPFFDKEPMSEREAWVWMIAKAAWEDTRHKVGKVMLDVPRGSFMVTLREMQSAFMWRSDTRVRNFLKRLEAEGMIERTAVGSRNAPKTHVTVCNYNEYQSSERTKASPKTHRERTKNAVKKQENNKQEEAKASLASKPPSKRGTRLPDDWTLPKQCGDWALSEGWGEAAIRAESEKFKDYWHSVAGSKGVKLDWKATWRNWMRNSKTPQLSAINGGHNGRPTSKSEQFVSSFVGGARRTS